MSKIEIAKILKPQGIRGEVKALPLTNLLAVFKNLDNCFVGDREFEISRISLRQGFLYVTFKGVSTRNEAETLRDKLIFIEREDLEKAKAEDEFLIDELIGMLLYNEKGEFVGQILDVVNYGACDVFIIEKDDRKMEVPYVEGVFSAKDGTLVVNQQKFDEVCV